MLFEVVLRNEFQQDWVTLLFVIILILLFLITVFYDSALYSILTLPLKRKNMSIPKKEFSGLYTSYNFLLFLVNSLVLSLLIYLSITFFYSPSFEDSGLVLYSKILLGYLMYSILYFSFNILLKKLFELHKHLEKIFFFKFRYLNTIVFWVIPLLFISVYTHDTAHLFFKITLLITMALFLWRFIAILLNNKKLVFNKLFYFILYLCTLEIIPLVLIFKLLDKT